MFTCYKAAGDTLGTLYQWDMNRTVFVSADDAPTAPVFHFCSVGDKKALVVVPESTTGGYTATIPNVLLQRPEAICLYLVCAEGSAVSTDDMAVLPVEPRPKPEDYTFVDSGAQTTLSALQARVSTTLDGLQAQMLSSQTHCTSTGNPHAVTAAQVGARPDTWTPTAAQVGAEPSGAVSTHNGASSAHSALFAAKAGKAVTFTVTLSAASWVSNAQTVSNALFVASGYAYTVSPADASFSDYAGAAVRAQNITANGSCTFVCDSAPSAALTVNILRTEVSA